MFVVTLTYKVELAQVDAYIAEHVAFLDKHYDLGHFLLSGRRVPRLGGVILAKVDTREQLDDILAEDPFYREALADYAVTEFVPTKSAPMLDDLLSV